jgi:hypothetical protein
VAGLSYPWALVLVEAARDASAPWTKAVG